MPTVVVGDGHPLIGLFKHLVQGTEHASTEELRARHMPAMNGAHASTTGRIDTIHVSANQLFFSPFKVRCFYFHLHLFQGGLQNNDTAIALFHLNMRYGLYNIFAILPIYS